MKYFLFLLIPIISFAQEMSSDNFTAMEQVIRAIVAKEQPGSESKIIATGEYTVFVPLLESEIRALASNNDNAEITLIKGSVQYSEPFREGWLSSYVTERKVEITYSINSVIKTEAKTDTVEIEDISTLERSGYVFTIGNSIETPIFGTIVEPVALIVTSAVAVYLFFTVRNN